MLLTKVFSRCERRKKGKRGIAQKNKKRDWKMTVTMVKNAVKISVRWCYFVVMIFMDINIISNKNNQHELTH